MTRSVIIALSSAMILVACGKPDEQVVNVYNWSDYIAPGLIEEFTAETGIKVNYDVYDSNEMLETKLLAGSTGYDIVVPSASFLARQIQAGVYQKLDKTKLTGFDNLDPKLVAQVATFDPENAYSVTHMWGTSGVGYNVAKIAERMPDAPVDSFAMFYDPKVVAKFADCGVTLLDAPSEVLGTVLLYLGKDANSEDPADLAAAEKVLMAVRPFIRNFNSSKYIEDLANGETCLALGWSGDVGIAADRAEEANNGIEVAYRIPTEGAVMFFDQLAIPADAKNVENAHAFINFLLRPEIAAKNTNYINYANPNLASREMIDPEVLSDPGVYPSEETMAKMAVDIPESPEFTRELTRVWTRVKTGR
jgi:putrescine transport system substrate-binding protein